MVILGPSGAGKSTLLNMLGGLDSPTSGSIKVNGKDISSLSNNELADYRAATVGFVFQFYNLIPTLTVYENVALVKEIAKNYLDMPDWSVYMPAFLLFFYKYYSLGQRVKHV